MPAQHDLTLHKNAMFYVQFVVKKSAVPLNLAGINGDFRIKSAVEDTTTYATWTTGGGQITTAAGGLFTVKVNTATVNALPAGVSYSYVARLTGYDIDTAAASAGFDYAFVEGNILVTEDP